MYRTLLLAVPLIMAFSATASAATGPDWPAPSITGEASPTSVAPKGTVVFDWNVVNRTSRVLPDTKLLTVLPEDWRATGSGCESDPAYPYVISCELGDLAPGARAQVRLEAVVKGAPGRHEISASAYSDLTPADAPAETASTTVTVTRR